MRPFHSHERRRQAQQHMFQAHDRTAPIRVILRHFLTLREGPLKIAFCLHYRFAVRIQAAIFKVVIEASVIQIDRPAGSHNIVRNGHFCVAKAGCVLKDPHAITRKSIVIGAGHFIDQLFIRNAGRDDPYVHAPFCRH